MNETRYTKSNHYIVSGPLSSEWENFVHYGLTEKVFCFQKFSDLLWEKKSSCDRMTLLKIKAEGWEFAKYLRSLKQFIQQWKDETIFEPEYFFYIFPEGFSDLLD